MRLIVVAVSSLVLAIFIANAFVKRDKIPRRIRRHMLWVQGMLIYAAYGNGVAYSKGYDFNEATAFGLFTLTGLAISIIWNPEGDDKLPPYDNSWGQKIIDLFRGNKDG